MNVNILIVKRDRDQAVPDPACHQAPGALYRHLPPWLPQCPPNQPYLCLLVWSSVSFKKLHITSLHVERHWQSLTAFPWYLNQFKTIQTHRSFHNGVARTFPTRHLPWTSLYFYSVTSDRTWPAVFLLSSLLKALVLTSWLLYPRCLSLWIKAAAKCSQINTWKLLLKCSLVWRGFNRKPAELQFYYLIIRKVAFSVGPLRDVAVARSLSPVTWCNSRQLIT